MTPKGKEIPLSPEMREIIELQLANFKAKFGRDPNPDDPIFFDPEMDTPQPMQDSLDEVLKIGADLGLDPAKLYAAKKTGRFVTAENSQYLTDEELLEWEEAVAEGREIMRTPQ